MPCTIKAQDFNYKTQFDLGGGASLFRIPNTLNITPGEAFATALNFDAHVNIKRPFDIGLSAIHHIYATEGDSNTTFINANGNSLLFIANYHLVDRKKFNLSVGSGFGVTGLNYQRVELVDSIKSNAMVKLKGSCMLLNVQMRYYFLKNLGLFFKTQIAAFNHRVASFTYNGTPISELENRPIEDVYFSFRGYNVQLGLSLRF